MPRPNKLSPTFAPKHVSLRGGGGCPQPVVEWLQHESGGGVCVAETRVDKRGLDLQTVITSASQWTRHAHKTCAGLASTRGHVDVCEDDATHDARLNDLASRRGHVDVT